MSITVRDNSIVIDKVKLVTGTSHDEKTSEDCTSYNIAAIEDMELHHMDVSSAFLNGDLEEDIYMAQPEGFVEPGQEHLVCHLKKSLYGLKCYNLCNLRLFSHHVMCL